MRKRYLPMLAESAEEPFSSGDWIFEIKWDGIRAISYVGEGKRLSIRSRNGNELADKFPELGELADLAQDAVLDGEIVVMKEGRADFQAVVGRAKASGRAAALRLAEEDPATYVVFDVLEAGGEDLTGRPLVERKEALKRVLREGRHVVVSARVEGDGIGYFRAALAKGIEGIMAKRKDSAYEAGSRSASWVKIKQLRGCDCVVVGYSEGQGSREGLFGALLLGLYDGRRLVFVGKVGTGFTDEGAKELMAALKPLRVDSLPIEADVKGAQWLEPRLVAEVAYQSVTRDGRLRMPRFKGIRLDKRPEECTVDQIKPKLEEYKGKRDFKTTPEPAGGAPASGGGVYVVQEHHARRVHYDLRLERGGVLKSWAVPKGMPESQGDKKLAIEVEDHPLEYGSFEGQIPEGQYGAGTVSIWDKGSYDTVSWGGDTIEVVIKGARVRGRYILTRFKKAGEKQWLLFKARDKVE